MDSIDLYLEADKWLYNDAGEYEFSPEGVRAAHDACISACIKALNSGKRVEVANTFTCL